MPRNNNNPYRSAVLSNSAKQSLSEGARVRAAAVLEPEVERIRKEYLHTVLFPDDYAYRMPDEETQPTVLYRSLREFELNANFDGTADAGKFSFAVKPILGAADNIHHYQVGIVDNTGGWPSDFSNPNTYVSSLSGEDPRVDPMVGPLTGLPLDYHSLYADNPSTGTLGTVYTPLLSAPTDGGTVVQGNLNVTYRSIPASMYTTLTLPNLGSITLTPSGTSNNDQFRLSTGTYNYKTIFTNVGTWSGTGGSGVWILLATDDNNNVVGYLSDASGSTDLYFGVLSQSNVNKLTTWDGNIFNASQALVYDIDYNIHFDERYWYTPIYTHALSSTNLRTGHVITTTSDFKLPGVSNSGAVIRLRPIGLSCLVTNLLPPINAGGVIVGYSAPSGDIDSYFYNTSSQFGPYQEWQVLARNNKGRFTHDGKFDKGTYVWSQPWDKNDTLMRLPLESLDYEYQGIIVSGQASPSVAISGNYVAARIRIAIVYEYTTDSRLFLGESCFGSTADLDWVLAYLAAQDHAYENADHLKRIKEILQTGVRMMMRTIPTVMTALKTASKIGALLV